MCRGRARERERDRNAVEASEVIICCAEGFVSRTRFGEGVCSAGAEVGKW